MKMRLQFLALFILTLQTSTLALTTTTTTTYSKNGNRRAFLQKSSSAFLLATAALPSTALAKDELFKANPLTNRVLEQIRIWEQAEADTLKYNGELEGGEQRPTTTGAYAQLLVPILGIAAELETLNRIIRQDERQSMLREAQQILQQGKYDKVAFKKTFNAYGDNIYYSDPDRANVYLGGGATPKTEQTLAYLQRNEILTNVEDMRAEVGFLLQNPNEAVDELQQLSKNAVTAMRKYLEVVPPAELVQARMRLKEQSS